MRGQQKKVKKIIITGKIVDEFSIKTEEFVAGDLMLYAIIDSRLPIETDDYNFKGYRGSFKAKIYDGKDWNHILLDEFFDERINKFPKNEFILPYFEQTKEELEKFAGKTLFKTYRDHYTLNEYIPGVFKGKKGHFNNKKK